MRNARTASHFAIVAGLLLGVATEAKTPELKLTLKTNTPIEQRKKEQIERLAEIYDLKKFTITRDIIIEQGATAHSMPVLTLNGRFLDNDDRALSQYVHEQGHWVLQRHRLDMRPMYRELTDTFPRIPSQYPLGSGGVQDSYYRLAVIMLEWQALEELVGVDRARDVMQFKQTDHYTALYTTVLERRSEMDRILKRYGVKW